MELLQLDMRDLRLLLHLLIHHLGALAQWRLELGNSGSLEFPSRDTIRKHNIQFTVGLKVSLTSDDDIVKTYPSLGFWKTEVAVCPRDCVGSQEEEATFGSPVPVGSTRCCLLGSKDLPVTSTQHSRGNLGINNPRNHISSSSQNDCLSPNFGSR